MPFFKRRNAVKVKEGKNAPKEPSIAEDEATVISEVNSMLNELVGVVSEKTDSLLKNSTNSFSENDISNQMNSTEAHRECSNAVSSSSSSEMCSNLPPKNTDSEKNDFVQKSERDETLSQVHIVSPQIDSAQKNDECTETVLTNCSQENGACISSEEKKDVSKLTDSMQKNDANTCQNNTTSKPSNSQQNDECKNLVTANDIVNQTNLAQTIDEDTNTLSSNSISNEMYSDEKNGECIKSDSTSNTSNIRKEEMCESNISMNDSLESHLIKNAALQEKEHFTKTTRSSSECGSGIESHTKYIRRKFGSEAEIMNICGKFLPPEQQKGINEAVMKYVDNLIKESIFKAVKSIDVGNLCEELVKGVSNRTNSLCSEESEEDFVVEQRLCSNSISELVELQNVENKTYEDQKVSTLSEYDRKSSEPESLENEADDTDRASFGGYLADLEDAASIDDLKSAEEDSLYSSSCSGLESKLNLHGCNSEISSNVTELESIGKSTDNQNQEIMRVNEEEQSSEQVGENEKSQLFEEKDDHIFQITPKENDEQPENNPSKEDSCENNKIILSSENQEETDKNSFTLANIHKADLKIISPENSEISLKSLDEEDLLMKNDFKMEEQKNDSQVKGGSLPNQNTSEEEERKKVNWRVGNLHVKLPHKSRGKTSLKAWKKRRVVIQPDEFVNDPTNHSLVISVYGSKKHETTFWHSVSSQKAVVFRSSSHTHRYAFTISEGGEAIIHLSAENESETQEWMAAIRAVLWPPSPFMELEKMLSGQEFEVSIIDNEFSYHAGLLGMYGYISITPKKLILLHPQQGYVIQEWYLNTVDKFQFVLQQKPNDMHKVLCMTTCKDSSTGQGDIILFCKEAVTLLQSLASNIHQVLSHHSKQEGGKYQKELEELAEWMVAPPQDCLNVENDEHYKVPPRQVKSLLDIPNFIFNKPLSPVASAIYPAPNTEVTETLDNTKNKLINRSQDSGISTCTSGDDFLNCSTASFVVGGGPMTGKSSDSELSDAYTPPRTPEVMRKKMLPEIVKEESSVLEE